jgi:hypothetical protein
MMLIFMRWRSNLFLLLVVVFVNLFSMAVSSVLFRYHHLLMITRKFMKKPDELILEGTNQFYVDVDKEEWKLETLCDIFGRWQGRVLWICFIILNSICITKQGWWRWRICLLLSNDFGSNSNGNEKEVWHQTSVLHFCKEAMSKLPASLSAIVLTNFF